MSPAVKNLAFRAQSKGDKILHPAAATTTAISSGGGGAVALTVAVWMTVVVFGCGFDSGRPLLENEISKACLTERKQRFCRCHHPCRVIAQ